MPRFWRPHGWLVLNQNRSQTFGWEHLNFSSASFVMVREIIHFPNQVSGELHKLVALWAPVQVPRPAFHDQWASSVQQSYYCHWLYCTREVTLNKYEF